MSPPDRGPGLTVLVLVPPGLPFLLQVQHRVLDLLEEEELSPLLSSD